MRVFASAETTSICILVLAAALCGAGQTAAQQPSEDQIAAVKSNCRSDFMAKCWGVPRGGTEAFQCLKKNLASLSAPCQQAVQAAIAAATPKAPSAAPAPAKQEGAPAAPAQPSAALAPETSPTIIGIIPPRKKLMVFRSCRKDLDAYCAGVEYGDGRQLRCLESNKASLSPDCQGALAKLAQ